MSCVLRGMDHLGFGVWGVWFIWIVEEVHGTRLHSLAPVSANGATESAPVEETDPTALVIW